MTPQEILIFVASFAIAGIIGIPPLVRSLKKIDELKRQADEAAKRAEEARERAAEAKLRAEEAQKRLEAIEKEQDLGHESLFEVLSVVAAGLSAFEDLDDDSKFQLATTKWKQVTKTFPPPPNPLPKSNEQDLKTVLRVFNAIMHTINEPEWLQRFREKLAELQKRDLLRLTKGGRKDVQKLINRLKPEANEQCADDYRQLPSKTISHSDGRRYDFVETLEHFLLSAPDNVADTTRLSSVLPDKSSLDIQRLRSDHILAQFTN